MSSYRLKSLPLLALVMSTAGALADETDTSMFSFSGFGTVGVVHSSEDKADFSSTRFKPDGAGYSHTWSADVDSLIAGQVTATLTPQLSAVLQVISEQDYDDSYRPRVEWANIKYQFTPDFSVRVGRTLLPVFLVTDYRKVGYANHWVRPPIDVYNLVPLSNSDGIDATYRVRIGDLTNTVQGIYGTADPKLPAGVGTAEFEDAWLFSYLGEYGAASVRLTYAKGDLTIKSFKPLFDGFRQFGPEGIAIADKYEVNDTPAKFVAVGGMYDPGAWFLMSEWGATDTQSALGKSTAWYVGGGYQLGKVTPYLTYSQAQADYLSDPGLTVSALPPPLVGPATDLNASLNALLSTIVDEDTVSVGARWDFATNFALKLQFDHIDIGAGSTGVLRNTQPGFQLGGTVDVFSATIDFVF